MTRVLVARVSKKRCHFREQSKWSRTYQVTLIAFTAMVGLVSGQFAFTFPLEHIQASRRNVTYEAKTSEILVVVASVACLLFVRQKSPAVLFAYLRLLTTGDQPQEHECSQRAGRGRSHGFPLSAPRQSEIDHGEPDDERLHQRRK